MVFSLSLRGNTVECRLEQSVRQKGRYSGNCVGGSNLMLYSLVVMFVLQLPFLDDVILNWVW